MRAGWRFGGSIAVVAAGALACTDPTFVDGDASDRDATVDEKHVTEVGAPVEQDGAPLEEERDATSGPAANDAASVMDSGDPPEPAAGDSATAAIQDAGGPAPDTGANGSISGGDAAAASALPDWARPLIGTYAKRSVMFSYDDSDTTGGPFNTRNVEDSILTVTQKGDGLEASIQLCNYKVELTGSLPFYFRNPAAIPPLKGRIMLGAPNSFGSEPMAQQLGFDRTRADCNGTMRRPKYPDQTWITGSTTCECSPARLPDDMNDCRITDGDQDGKAGITGRAQALPVAQLSDLVMVFESSLTLVDGQIMANKSHTLREVRSQGQSCINARSDLCNFGNNQLCPRGTTKLIHQEQLTCANFPDAAFGELPAYPTQVDCR